MNSPTILELLDKQYELQKKLGTAEISGPNAIRNIQAMQVECVEALNELDWKWWPHKTPMHDREAFVSEMVDVLQFWLNAMNALGVGISEFNTAWETNMQKFEERHGAKQLGLFIEDPDTSVPSTFED